MRDPIAILQEAIERAEAIFQTPIRVVTGAEDGELQFRILWGGEAADGYAKLEEFDRWWIHYSHILRGIGFHLELVVEVPHAT
jgi:hypothetical protein